MYTAQSTVSTVHTTVMSQLNPERDQSSGTIRNTTYIPYCTYIPTSSYLHTLPLKTNKTPPFRNKFKKRTKEQVREYNYFARALSLVGFYHAQDLAYVGAYKRH